VALGLTRERYVPAFVTLAVAALAVRLVVIGITEASFTRADPANYDRHAVSIAAGRGYPQTNIAGLHGPSAHVPPLYPYALAGLYELTGIGPERWTAARVIQAFLGALMVVLIGLLASRLWGRRAALTSMAIAAVYPPLVTWGTTLFPEISFIGLELGAVLAVLAYRRTGGRYRWAVLAGFLAGLATLARANGLVLLVPLAIGAWSRRPLLSWRALAGPALLGVVAVLTVLPWTVRNAVVMEAFLPVTTQGGFALSGVYNDASRTDPVNPGAWRPPATVYGEEIRDLTEVQADRTLRRIALRYMKDHPGYVLQVWANNAYRLLDLQGPGSHRRLEPSTGVTPNPSRPNVYTFYVVALLAVAGAFTRAARRAPVYVWLLPVLLLGSSVFLLGDNRHRAPADPFLILLAGLAVTAVWERRLRRRRARRAAAS
jgi:4-amino-4-deoxy-L-arabinose transferase-like glycosyltransferase